MSRAGQSLEYFQNVLCVGETSLLNMLTSSVFLVGGVTVAVTNAQQF
jgi:hypothetical protein